MLAFGDRALVPFLLSSLKLSIEVQNIFFSKCSGNWISPCVTARAGCVCIEFFLLFSLYETFSYTSSCYIDSLDVRGCLLPQSCLW